MSQTTVSTIERLIPELTFQEKLRIFERLAQQLRYTMPHQTKSTPELSKPQNLYGVWSNRVPDDFDLDSALHDIRQQWQDTWETEES